MEHLVVEESLRAMVKEEVRDEEEINVAGGEEDRHSL